MLEASERLHRAYELVTTPPASPRSDDDRADVLAAATLLGAPKAILDDAAAAKR